MRSMRDKNSFFIDKSHVWHGNCLKWLFVRDLLISLLLHRELSRLKQISQSGLLGNYYYLSSKLGSNAVNIPSNGKNAHI